MSCVYHTTENTSHLLEGTVTGPTLTPTHRTVVGCTLLCTAAVSHKTSHHHHNRPLNCGPPSTTPVTKQAFLVQPCHCLCSPENKHTGHPRVSSTWSPNAHSWCVAMPRAQTGFLHSWAVTPATLPGEAPLRPLDIARGKESGGSPGFDLCLAGHTALS